jgi:hypothetical protein
LIYAAAFAPGRAKTEKRNERSKRFYKLNSGKVRQVKVSTSFFAKKEAKKILII